MYRLLLSSVLLCVGGVAALSPTLHARAVHVSLNGGSFMVSSSAGPRHRLPLGRARLPRCMLPELKDGTSPDVDGRRAAAYLRLARVRLLNNIAFFNGLVISFVALSVAYELFGTDIRAIAALYYFDLGSDLYPGFARAAVAADLFARLPASLIHDYEALVPTNPIFYKACTSGVAYTLGDFISQIFQGRDLRTIDLSRSARSGAAGFIGHGPLCHYWMSFMVSP